MSLYLDKKCRLCRAEGMKLYLKGSRCDSPKCPVEKRGVAPGQHGQRRRRLSEFALRLREKQKVKRMYGMRERQFKRFFAVAHRVTGNTGEVLMTLLERRLDNVVYRSGWGSSLAQARQMIAHRHITVNDRIVSIPSYLIKPGDTVSVCPSAQEYVNHNKEKNRRNISPSWLSVVSESPSTLKIIQTPALSELPIPVNSQLIVEFYTK